MKDSEIKKAATAWAEAKYGPTCDGKDGFEAGVWWALEKVFKDLNEDTFEDYAWEHICEILSIEDD